MTAPRPFPGQECGGAGERELHGTRVIRNDRARQVRRLSGLAREANETAARLCRAVEHGLLGVGSLRPEPIDVSNHEARVLAGQLLQVESHPRERLRSVVGKEHVGLGEESLHDSGAELGVHIEIDRALALVHGDELGPVRLRGKLVPITAGVATGVTHRWLDLDDVGSHVGEVEPHARSLDRAGKLHGSKSL